MKKEQIILKYYKDNFTKKKFLEYLLDKGIQMSIQTLIKYSKKHDLTFREGRGKIALIQQNPFTLGNIDNEYWLGYLIGDGHVSKKMITIVSKDLDHLKTYKHHLNNKVKVSKKGKIYQCYFGNSMIFEELQKLGFVSDKRYYCEFKFDLNFNIVRGLFDADGYSRSRKNNLEWKITSGNTFLVQLLEDFIKNQSCPYRTVKKGNAYDVFLQGGRLKYVPFLNNLYKEGQYTLYRKFLKNSGFIEQSIIENRVNCWKALRDKIATT